MPNLNRPPPRSETTQAPSRLQRSTSVPKLYLRSASASPSSPTRPPHPSFVLRSSVKHHAFPDVPYPVSYHKNILTCDALDHATLKSLYQSCSSIDYTDRPLPTRCLDLGCGPGAWVLEAANEWPDCEFVGFDLVNLQIPSHCLPPQCASRIKWVQGNFLSPLPFEDGYFDHVHIRQIARGVPEDKWDLMIAEVARVLKVGGCVEIFEEDIIFPVLPRSSTATPRKRKRKSPTTPRPVSTPNGAFPITKHLPSASLLEHDHAILENLFYRLFERRFINLQPTALIMGTLNIHMRHTGGSPLINFPLPPAPPPDDAPAHAVGNGDSSRSTTPRMLDRNVESTSLRSLTPMPERHDVDEDWQGSISSTTSSSRCSTLYSEKSTPATSVSEFDDPAEGPIAFFSDAGLATLSSNGKEPFKMLPEERLLLTAGTLGLHLYRRRLARYPGSLRRVLSFTDVSTSISGVMACREAMWSEYQRALQVQDPLLDLLEWEDHELELSDRDKFDNLMSRYQADMEARYPIADALVSELHWDAPRRDFNKEDKAAKRAVAEVRSDALRLERSGIGAVPEGSRVCRKARIFIGRKGAVFGVE